MSETKQLFSASLAKDAVYKTGLRSFLEYRDLGVEKATHGQFRAHVIRVKAEDGGHHDLHTTGLHRHLCDFQMVYVLKGWIRFVYDGHGEHTLARATASCSPRASCTTSWRARTIIELPRDLLARGPHDRGRRRREDRRGGALDAPCSPIASSASCARAASRWGRTWAASPIRRSSRSSATPGSTPPSSTWSTRASTCATCS